MFVLPNSARGAREGPRSVCEVWLVNIRVIMAARTARARARLLRRDVDLRVSAESRDLFPNEAERAPPPAVALGVHSSMKGARARARARARAHGSQSVRVSVAGVSVLTPRSGGTQP